MGKETLTSLPSHDWNFQMAPQWVECHHHHHLCCLSWYCYNRQIDPGVKLTRLQRMLKWEITGTVICSGRVSALDLLRGVTEPFRLIWRDVLCYQYSTGLSASVLNMWNGFDGSCQWANKYPCLFFEGVIILIRPLIWITMETVSCLWCCLKNHRDQ